MDTSFRGYISERYINLKIGSLKREIFADEVWEILQSSYAPIGGLKGNGFSSKDEMINKIPFWKIHTIDGSVKAVEMYKDKSGRKAVAMGTDGTPEGKDALKKILIADFGRGRAWGEISGPALRFVKKLFSEEELTRLLIPFEKVKELLRADWEEGKILPIEGEEFEFQHLLGSEWITKVAIGTPGNRIY